MRGPTWPPLSSPRPHDADAYVRLLLDGDSHTQQPLEPNGLSQTFVIGADFAGSQASVFALGETDFHGRI
jgi:hypothetical protein